MKVTRQHHLAQVQRINAVLDLLENFTIRGDLDNHELEYINDLENKLSIFGEYTMDKCTILEKKANTILGKFSPVA
jgi:hypothetical protein